VAVIPVRIYGDPVLRRRAVEVKGVDEPLRAFIADLFETMEAYHGVGLAATQVGDLRRVCVVNVPLDEGGEARHALVNPVIRSRSGSETGEEGCLSIPGVYEDVARSLEIEVEALDENGRPVVLQAEGYVARAIQHEVDHLDGVLFTDRLSPLKRQFLKRTLDALARGEMPEGYQPPVPPAGGGAR